jgi:membrane protein implicated in regulation of membrane protease activity
MTDRTIDQVLAGCERYWRSTGVPADAVAEMRAELQTHLEAASVAGKDVDVVVGPDLDAFAEEWAAIYRSAPEKDAPAGAASAGSGEPSSGWRWIWLTIGVLAVGFALIALLAPKGDPMEDQWQWWWVGAAVVLGIGELLTAGFFLLPFAVGAAAAAILAFMGVSFALQLVTFVVISVVFLAVLQRFAREEQSDGTEPAGAGRFNGKRAIVIEPINRLEGTGSVRLETEQWRATTDGDQEIPVGQEVTIREVRGTRLVVEQE